MPIPGPEPNEPTGKYISRCISFLASENSKIPAGPARAAACYARLRKARPGAAPKKEEILEVLSKIDLGCEDCIFEVADEVLKTLEDSESMKDYNEIELPEQLKPIDARKEEEFTFLEPKVKKASTTNTPAWGSIAHNQSDHPNKSDFIVQRGDTWSDWKLPYKYKGKIHCGGVSAAYAASRGARGGVRGGLTPEEKARLESARRACGFTKEAEEAIKAYACECIKCGYKMESDQHCRDIKCPKCSGEMRRAERPGPGKESDDQIVETVEGMVQEDKFHPLPDQPANPSMANVEWPELEEVDLPKHLQPSYERSNLEELEDLLNKP